MTETLMDNVFCTAIMEVLKTPLFPESGVFSLNDVKEDFENNGFGDEENIGELDDCFYGDDSRFYKVIARTPLASIHSNTNKKLAKKLKMAKAQKAKSCRFCENNEEPPHVYNSHSLRNSFGTLTCPRLRNYVCPICYATGDDAHTIRYCNKKPIFVIKDDKSASIRKWRIVPDLIRV